MAYGSASTSCTQYYQLAKFIEPLCPLWLSRLSFFQGDALYSYTVITVDASEKFGAIHHRMPAILDCQEAIIHVARSTHSNLTGIIMYNVWQLAIAISSVIVM